MPSTTRTGTPYPAYSDVPDVPADLQALILGLEPYTNLRYANTGARDADITSPINGMICAVAGLPYIYSGGSWKRIKIEDDVASGVTTFTPSWTNTVLGTGAINEGYYQVIGGMVLWGFRTEFGTSPSFSTTIQLALPVTAYIPATGTQIQGPAGNWNFRDTSAGDHYAGSMGLWDGTGTLVSFSGAYDSTATKDNSRIAPAKPFTVGAQDVLSGSGVYRKA